MGYGCRVENDMQDGHGAGGNRISEYASPNVSVFVP